MQDNQENHLGAINVKQSRRLTFNFSVLSRATSALFISSEVENFNPVLSIKSTIIMAMLRHHLETRRMVSEIAFDSEYLDDEGIEDLVKAWKHTSKLELGICYAHSYKAHLQDIASRPSQPELFEECEKEDAPFLPSSHECQCRRCQLNQG